MSTDAILFEQQGGIATITLNTPDKGNAIDLVFVRRLFEIAMQCDLDPSIRCVVLTGNGRLFCAGGDITLMQPERRARWGRHPARPRGPCK